MQNERERTTELERELRQERKKHIRLSVEIELLSNLGGAGNAKASVAQRYSIFMT